MYGTVDTEVWLSIVYVNCGTYEYSNAYCQTDRQTYLPTAYARCLGWVGSRKTDDQSTKSNQINQSVSISQSHAVCGLLHARAKGLGRLHPSELREGAKASCSVHSQHAFSTSLSLHRGWTRTMMRIWLCEPIKHGSKRNGWIVWCRVAAAAADCSGQQPGSSRTRSMHSSTALENLLCYQLPHPSPFDCVLFIHWLLWRRRYAVDQFAASCIPS